MKKLYFILLIPFLMATQCDDNTIPSYKTNYIIQNDSSINLILLSEDNTEIVIESQADYQLGAEITDTDIIVTPSENNVFDHVDLYKLDDNNNLVLAYQQTPISDDLWIFETANTYSYRLIITD